MRTPTIVLLLSGPVSVGKTTLRDLLISRHGFSAIRSSAYLRELADSQAGDVGRLALQELGDALDARTDFRWVVDDVAVPAIAADATTSRWLFDAVRKRRQVEHFRERFGRHVFHLHLDAPEAVLRARYEHRLLQLNEPVSGAYDKAIAHDNEVQSRGLIHIADAVVQTHPGEPDDVLAAVLIALQSVPKAGDA